MNNQVSMALDVSAPFPVVVDLVGVERQCRESKESDRCLAEVSDVFAFWKWDSRRFGSWSLRGCDLGAEDPVPARFQMS